MTTEPKVRYNKILSDRLMDAIGAALGVEIGNAHRIVLDLEVRKPVRVYIEFYGDERMLDMDLPQLARGDIELRTTRSAQRNEDA